MQTPGFQKSETVGKVWSFTTGKLNMTLVLCSICGSLMSPNSYSYNQGDGTFVQADEHTTFPLPGNPPDNCPVCAKAAAREVLQTPQIIEKGSGVAIGGYNYHLNDYAMVESDGGPCLIGKIINIKSSSKARDLGACEVSLQLLGRVRAMVTVAKEDLYQDEVNFVCGCCTFT